MSGNKANIISIVFLLIILFVSVSCTKQTSEWKGTITEEDGIIVVKNPDDPIYKEPLFTVEEE